MIDSMNIRLIALVRKLNTCLTSTINCKFGGCASLSVCMCIGVELVR